MDYAAIILNITLYNRNKNTKVNISLLFKSGLRTFTVRCVALDAFSKHWPYILVWIKRQFFVRWMFIYLPVVRFFPICALVDHMSIGRGNIWLIADLDSRWGHPSDQPGNWLLWGTLSAKFFRHWKYINPWVFHGKFTPRSYKIPPL